MAIQIESFGFFLSLIGRQKLNIAPMVAASFFVIAILEWFNRLPHFVRNDKKDIADSGLESCSEA